MSAGIIEHRDRVFAAIRGYQERRKRPALRKPPARCSTGRTFLIVERESVDGGRSGGLFLALRE